MVLAHHAGEIRVDRRLAADRRTDRLGPQPVRIAECRELDQVAIAVDEALAPHVVAAMAGADEGGAALAAGGCRHFVVSKTAASRLARAFMGGGALLMPAGGSPPLAPLCPCA